MLFLTHNSRQVKSGTGDSSSADEGYQVESIQQDARLTERNIEKFNLDQENKKVEQEILNKVSKLFQQHYKDHTDPKLKDQMVLVRERDKKKLKLQLKLLQIRYEKKDVKKMLEYKLIQSKQIAMQKQMQSPLTQSSFNTARQSVMRTNKPTMNLISPSANTKSRNTINIPRHSNTKLMAMTQREEKKSIYEGWVALESDRIVSEATKNPIFLTQSARKQYLEDLEEPFYSSDSSSKSVKPKKKKLKPIIITKNQILQKKNLLYSSLGLKQDINDIIRVDRDVEDIDLFSGTDSGRVKLPHEIHSPRDLGISNQKLINLKALSNMKSIRSYSPIFEDQRMQQLLTRQKKRGGQKMRTRTFNVELRSRKVKDERISSMMITDFNVLREPKFSQNLITVIVEVLTRNVSELSNKLFNTNEISWPHFVKWLQRGQLRHINLLIEEIIGICIQIGVMFLLKFKDQPEKIGISDPRYILNLDSVIKDEQEVFFDNLLKFKEIRQFIFHSFDCYNLMTSQLGYQPISHEELMILQGEILEIRFKVSEILWLLEKYLKLYTEDKLAGRVKVDVYVKRTAEESDEEKKESQMQYIRRFLKKTKKIIRSRDDPEFKFRVATKNAKEIIDQQTEAKRKQLPDYLQTERYSGEKMSDLQRSRVIINSYLYRLTKRQASVQGMVLLRP